MLKKSENLSQPFSQLFHKSPLKHLFSWQPNRYRITNTFQNFLLYRLNKRKPENQILQIHKIPKSSLHIFFNYLLEEETCNFNQKRKKRRTMQKEREREREGKKVECRVKKQIRSGEKVKSLKLKK